MEYYVILADGTKFGPANIELLNQWAAQGRILPDTVIERATDGVRGPASLLPGLTLPASASTPAVPGEVPPPAANPDAPSTAGRPDAAQFKEPDFVQTPKPMTPPTYGDAASAPTGLQGGYPREQVYAADQVPGQLQGKFNWGAFFLTWIWGVNHKAYVTLVTLGVWAVYILGSIVNKSEQPAMTPGQATDLTRQPHLGIGAIVGLLCLVAALGLKIWYGVKGNEWAWFSGRFRDPQDCAKCQTSWGWWGLGVAALGCICVGAIFALAFAAIAAAVGAAR